MEIFWARSDDIGIYLDDEIMFQHNKSSNRINDNDSIEHRTYNVPNLSIYIPIYSVFIIICYSFMVHSFHKANVNVNKDWNDSNIVLLIF